jgi:hypothetical protein
MKTGAIDREVVRQYLLGQLDDNEEIEARVSDEIFFEGEAARIVDEIEDEIIEEYEERRLDSADRKAVEEYFLRSSERRQKLRFYRVLQQHLAAKQPQAEPQTATERVQTNKRGRQGLAGRSSVRWMTRVLIYGQAAALLAFAVLGWVYVSRVRQGRAPSHDQALPAAAEVTSPTPLQSPAVVLTLVSDRSRSTGPQVPRAEITATTERIIVEIALPTSKAGPFDVHLETREGREANWTAKLLPLVSPEGDARLVFDLPAQRMQPGFYTLVIASDPPVQGARRYYDFEVKLTK